MWCVLCQGTMFDDDIGTHYMEEHMEETANALFNMYSMALDSMVVDVMAEFYEEEEEEDE